MSKRNPPVYQPHGSYQMAMPVLLTHSSTASSVVNVYASRDWLDGKDGTATVAVYGPLIGVPLFVVQEARW